MAAWLTVICDIDSVGASRAVDQARPFDVAACLTRNDVGRHAGAFDLHSVAMIDVAQMAPERVVGLDSTGHSR